MRSANAPLLWFGLFEQCKTFEASDLSASLPDPAGAWMSPPRPRTSREAYEAALRQVAQYIQAGDVYQVNWSYRADVTLVGNPLAAYARLRDAGKGGWSGVAHDGRTWLLSASPELFFSLRGGDVESRPMKGTARRFSDPEQDQEAAIALKCDQKELAENLMIVDLIRNDISRIAARGSVHVPALFTVETYPTFHTMVSTVRGRVREGLDAIDVVGALFPCGSITGAPKIRAMEIISDLEHDARGAYCGSMGWMSPDGAAEMNVAIRTLTVRDGQAEVGIGSAIVFDSSIDGEWEECQTKSKFVTFGAPGFDLIETMRFDPGIGVAYLDLHMSRLKASAHVFSYQFDEAAIRAAVARAVLDGETPCVLRLTLSEAGMCRVERQPLRMFSTTPARVRSAPLPVARDDFRLRHKTSLRRFYDEARADAGSDEVIFLDDEGFVTEGSFTNVFVRQDGALATPPAYRGLLPGVLRQALLADGRAIERDVRIEDLRDGFLIGNAVRGVVDAQLMTGPAVAVRR
jgi:para-aminobenzoate synthetase/4-amino-4-deoxychorismate lyase